MIPPVRWSQFNQFDELRSPFITGSGQKLLKLTFDSASLRDQTDESSLAIELLTELSHLDEIEALSSEPKSCRELRIGLPDEAADIIPVDVILEGKPQIRSHVQRIGQWSRIATRLADRAACPEDQDEKPLYEL